MSPKHIEANFWELLEGESLQGTDGRVMTGKQIVRVTDFPKHGLQSIQGTELLPTGQTREMTIEIKGTIETAVKPCEPPARRP